LFTDVYITLIQIPCRTAMRGSFPLNGTYFQVNEVSLLQLYATLVVQEHNMDASQKPYPTGQKDYHLPSWKEDYLLFCPIHESENLEPIIPWLWYIMQVFADHESSLNPIDVPRAWIWNLRRRTVYFGTSVSTIFKGKEIIYLQAFTA
jgi:hypothetical protein